LPWLRIEGAEIVRKIVFKEDPSTTYFGTGDLANLRAATKLLGMSPQEPRGFNEAEGTHNA